MMQKSQPHRKDKYNRKKKGKWRAKGKTFY
jgi:hypothetical protein